MTNRLKNVESLWWAVVDFYFALRSRGLMQMLFIALAVQMVFFWWDEAGNDR